MSLSEVFVHYLGNPIWRIYKGENDIVNYANEFKKLWNTSSDQLEAYRLSSLQSIIKHTASSSIYYSDLFKEYNIDCSQITSFAELQSLPFMTKEILNSKMRDILSDKFSKDELIKSSTGGSSGVPLTFYRDKRATFKRRAQDYLFNSQIGISAGIKRAWVWGSPVDSFVLKGVKARLANFLSERAIYFYSFDANEEKIKLFLKKLIEYKPKALFAYPNMLALIADTARKYNLIPDSLEKVIVTAEPLYDFQRDLFSNVFGVQVFERYGSREIGTVASEDYNHSGMNMFEPSYYFELINSKGEVTTEGEGELVVTDLCNYAMPLIRYRTGDNVKITEQDANSNCSWRRITSVGGRVVDLLQRPDGSYIAGEAVIMSLREAGFRFKVQVNQQSPDHLEISYLGSDEISSELKEDFQNRINQLLGAQITVTYKPVAELTYDNSGKYRYVTSQCS